VIGPDLSPRITCGVLTFSHKVGVVVSVVTVGVPHAIGVGDANDGAPLVVTVGTIIEVQLCERFVVRAGVSG
jgi:hypothetical protein